MNQPGFHGILVINESTTSRQGQIQKTASRGSPIRFHFSVVFLFVAHRLTGGFELCSNGDGAFTDDFWWASLVKVRSVAISPWLFAANIGDEIQASEI